MAMIGCGESLCFSATPLIRRAIWSAPPPVPAGMTNSIGWVGSHARAGPVASAAAMTTGARTKERPTRPWRLIVCPPVGVPVAERPGRAHTGRSFACIARKSGESRTSVSWKVRATIDTDQCRRQDVPPTNGVGPTEAPLGASRRCCERSTGRWTEPIVRASVEVAVGGVRQELAELFRQHEAVEDLGGLAQAPLLRAAQLGELLVPDLLVEVRRRRPAVGELRRVPDPLPELRARDLRRRRVLHQGCGWRQRRCPAARSSRTGAPRRRCSGNRLRDGAAGD